MYRVLIVDDDMLVRMDIRALIDWNRLETDLLDDAVNGIEALKIIERHSPEIIILDISMPLMSGLEVIARLKEIKYQGKIIVLSCHDDFDSVKEALKMGASDYLLKHLLKPEDLAESVKKAVHQLQIENRDRQEETRIRQLSKQSLSMLTDKFMKDLIYGSVKNANELVERLNQLNLKMVISKYAIILIEIDEMHSLKERYQEGHLEVISQSIRKIINEDIGNTNSCISGCIENGRYCVLMNFDNAQSYMGINSKVYEVCSRILTNVKNFLNISVSVGISKVFTDISCVHDGFSQARLALDGKLYLGKNRIIHFSEIENYNNKPENLFKDFEYEIYEAVTSGNANLHVHIEKVFSRIKDHYIKTEYIRLLSFEMLALVSRMAKDFGIGYEEVFGCEHLPYRYVLSLETINEIQSWFIRICENIILITGRDKSAAAREVRPEIKKALEYIEKNYMKDISLQEISDHSNLSRTYFCNLFKQEAGENFIEYLSKFRIEKAKILLKNPKMKIYEVGTACGFDNYRYFTKLFREMAGISPGEYRESLGAGKP